MTRPLLAREYDVPKKPVFVLDNMEIVQSTDATAYMPNSITDSVMYGTNGNIGLRHLTQLETIGFKTQVMLNGVHHVVPVENSSKCSALPQEKHVGAHVCIVDLDCLVDGESGTLSGIPERRLSLRDGAYRSVCEDVMSADGGLVFDTSYVRTVGTTDLNLWAAQLTCSNFRCSRTESLGPADTLDERAGSVLSQWSPFSTVGGCRDTTPGTNGWGIASNVPDTSMDSFPATPQAIPIRSMGCGRSFRLELSATYTVGLEEWEVIKAEQMDEVWQRSLSSGIMVNSTMAVTCTVDYGSNRTRISPEVEMKVNKDTSTDLPPSSIERYGTGTFTKDHAAQQGGTTSSNAKWAKSGTDIGSAYGDDFNEKGFTVRARFLFLLLEDSIPESVKLTFKTRHHSDGLPSTRAFPSTASIIEDRRKALETFWSQFDVDLQLQEELTPNRMRMSLLYNAFRLFGMSFNIDRGLPQSGCSSDGEGLQYDLSQYIYHGIYFTLTQPDAALRLLKSLYALLPVTRKNAQELYLPYGAVYPRTTITGINCRTHASINNTYFHVNAEIGYLIAFYFSAAASITVEDRLMLLELLLETVRVWPPLGEWQEDRTVFRLDNIASVDEYNTCASGNFYVHLSARENTATSVRVFQKQEKIIGTERIDALLARINMTREEIAELGNVSRAISVQRDDRLCVYLVHDNFDTLAEWKEELPKHPLKSNYHPLAIYRHKLVDIPDVLLGMALYKHRFEIHEFTSNLYYYMPLTTFDSPEALGIVAIAQCCARLNYAQPMPYLRALGNLDLDNVLYSAEEGLHFGAMSCSLLTFLCGVGGVGHQCGTIHLNPILPAGVSHYHFTIHWRGALLRVSLNADTVAYELVSGDSVRFIHGMAKNRIHLHTGFRHVEATRKLSIPRISFSQINQFDGAIVLCDCIFDNLLEYNYVSWLRTLELLFDNYRTLHNRSIPPLNPEEFIEKVVYQSEEREIAFSGIHNVLLSRDICLELGTPDDAEIVETRQGLANAKVAEMAELISNQVPQVIPEMFQLLRCLAQNGVALAVVTYSRSLTQLLAHNNELASLFAARIDGEEAHDLKIRGRPHLDLFTRAAEKIHINPSRCVVISHHLDRDYSAVELARFRMFLDMEDPFVSSRTEPCPYPTLDEDYIEKHRRDNPVVIRLPPRSIPVSIDDIEDLVDGRVPLHL